MRLNQIARANVIVFFIFYILCSIPLGSGALVWKHLPRYNLLRTLQWRNNEHDGVSNHRHHNCSLKHLSRQGQRKNIKVPRHWSLWGDFTGDRWIPRTKASNAEMSPFDDVIMKQLHSCCLLILATSKRSTLLICRISSSQNEIMSYFISTVLHAQVSMGLLQNGLSSISVI